MNIPPAVMKPVLLSALSGLLNLFMAASPLHATEARVLGVRRTDGDPPALLLKVPDDAVLSVRDVSAMLDAAGSRGGDASPRQVRAALNGRRFGDVAVVAPPESRTASRRPGPLVARASPGKKPAPRPAAKVPAAAVKPDVTIFDPDAPKKTDVPPPQEPPKP